MSSYISSYDNRLYVQAETKFGAVGTISEANKIPAVKLAVKTELDQRQRKDKTGRTFRGIPTGVRTRTKFRLNSYMTAWNGRPDGEAHAALLASAMGRPVTYFPGSQALASSPTNLTFAGSHGLEPGQTIACGGELRFVATVMDASSVAVNAPFSVTAGTAMNMSPTLTYRLGQESLSASIFDFWSPDDAVHRILCGAVVDELRVKVNGDFHEFQFAGPAADVLDSSTFSAGQAGLSEFPMEPALHASDYAIIPGHLGQAWIGVLPYEVQTLTDAELLLKNGVELRATEFGQQTAKCFSTGMRDVTLRFSIYETTDSGTRALYQAARQRTPMSAMIQLGSEPGHLVGAYVQTVVPDVPEFDDDDRRLQWHFTNSRAQGIADDELVLGFA